MPMHVPRCARKRKDTWDATSRIPVAYPVCARNGVTSKSETYLADYVEKNTTVEHVDLYQVMRAAGQIETLLGLTAHTKYDKPKSRGH